MTAYNKLVRDKIPEMLDAKGVLYEKRIAEDAEYKAELIKKLGEEAAEFHEAGDIEELADVIEVLEAIKKRPELKKGEKVGREKLVVGGVFEGKIILKEKNRYDAS